MKSTFFGEVIWLSKVTDPVLFLVRRLIQATSKSFATRGATHIRCAFHRLSSAPTSIETRPPVALMTAWALVPWAPNELTPIMDSGTALVDGVAAGPLLAMRTGLSRMAPWTCGLRCLMCRAGAMAFRDATWMASQMPTVPAADSWWPVYPLTVAKRNGCGLLRASATAAMAPISMGSPRLVPLECSCSPLTSSGLMDPLYQASLRSCCWAGPLGAVSELARPLVLTALPRMLAIATVLSFRPASVQRISVRAASPLAYPSADASSVLERPSGEIICALVSISVDSGTRHSSTPETIADCMPDSLKAEHAMLVATRDAEHAVSTLTAGPFAANTYANLPLATLGDAEVKLNALIGIPLRWLKDS